LVPASWAKKLDFLFARKCIAKRNTLLFQDARRGKRSGWRSPDLALEIKAEIEKLGRQVQNIEMSTGNGKLRRMCGDCFGAFGVGQIHAGAKRY